MTEIEICHQSSSALMLIAFTAIAFFFMAQQSHAQTTTTNFTTNFLGTNTWNGTTSTNAAATNNYLFTNTTFVVTNVVTSNSPTSVTTNKTGTNITTSSSASPAFPFLTSFTNDFVYSNNYGNTNAQVFSFSNNSSNSAVWAYNLTISGYSNNVTFTNMAALRIGNTGTFTNASGLTNISAGIVYLYNTTPDSPYNNPITLSGNMAVFWANVSGHSSSARSINQNLGSLCLSNFGVNQAGSTTANNYNNANAMTLNGTGNTTIVGVITNKAWTNAAGSNNTYALVVGGGVINIATTNVTNGYGTLGWNSGLRITNSGSVFVAGQNSLGSQSWNVKIGTTNGGTTTFGVFTSNVWATNSDLTCTLTNNFDIANAAVPATNVFRPQSGRTLTLSGAISGSVNGTIVADAGTLVLSGANTALSLPLVVTNGGTLVASNANALGSGSVTVASNATLKVNAAITNRVTNNGVSNNSGVTIADGGSLVSSNGYSGLGPLTLRATTTNNRASFTCSLPFGTTNVGPLNLGGNSALTLNLETTINSSGEVVITNTNNLIIVQNSSAATTVGTNNLVVGTSVSGANSNSIALTGSAVGSPTIPIALGSTYTNTVNNYRYTFTNSSNSTALQLIVQVPAGARDPQELIFVGDNGSGTGTWNTNTDNLVWLTTNAATDYFTSGDSALFTTNANVDVALVGVRSDIVTFTNAVQTLVSLDGGDVNANRVNVIGGGGVTLSNNMIVNGIETISSGTLTIDTGNTNSVGGLVLSGGTITGSGVLTNSATYTMQSGVADIVLNGTNGLTKSTEGNVTLSVNNTYTGGTTVNAGTLILRDAGTLGSTNNALSIVGGTLNLGTKSLTSGAFTLDSGTLSNGTLTASSYALNNAGTISAILSGLGGLTKSGAGTAILTADNNYSGGTTISGGTLQLGNGGATGTVAGNVVNSGTLVFNRSNSLNFSSSVISGSGALTIDGGTITLGTNNTFAGIVTVNSGAVASVAQFGTNGVTANPSASSFGINGNSTSNKVTFNGGTVRYTGAGESGTNFLSFTTNGGTIDASGTGALMLKKGTGGAALIGDGNRTMTYTGLNTMTNQQNAAISNSATGITTVAKRGTGNWQFSGSSTFTGGLDIYEGRIIVGGAGEISTGLGNGDIRIYNGGGIRSSSTTTRVDSTNHVYKLGGSNYIDTMDLGQVTLTNNTTIVSFTALGGETLNSGGSSTTTTLGSYSGIQESGGSFSLTKAGAALSTLILNNSNNYSGGTFVTSGTLIVTNNTNNSNIGTLGTSASAVTVSGGTLDLGAADRTNGAVTISAGTLTNGAMNATTLTISGGTVASNMTNRAATINISGGTLGTSTLSASSAFNFTGDNPGTVSAVLSGAGSLTRSGTGMLTLSGSNTYAGGTVISNSAIGITNAANVGNGSLRLTGISDAPAKLVNLMSSGTSDTSTSLSIGAVTMDGNAILSLRNAYTEFSVASLSLTGTLNQIEIDPFGWATGSIYTLLSSSSDISGADTMSLLVGGKTISVGQSDTVGRKTYEFNYNNSRTDLGNDISYQVNVTGDPYNLLWNGNVNDVWSTSDVDKNWSQASDTSTDVAFVTGDNATFTGLGASATNIVVDSGGVTAGTMTVADNSGSLILSGGNVSAALTVGSGGNLIVEGTVTPTGTLTLNGGILQIGSGGTNGALGNANAINMTNDGSLIVNLSTNYYLSNQITGNGSFRNVGTGTTLMTTNNTYSGQTLVAAGTLQIGSTAAGGTNATPGSGEIVVSNGATLAFKRSSVYTNANNISGEGSVSQLGTSSLELSGTNTFSGGLYLNTNNSGTVWATNGTNLGSGTIYAVSSNSKIGLSKFGLNAGDPRNMTITNLMSTSLSNNSTDVLAFQPGGTNSGGTNFFTNNVSITLDGKVTGAGWLKISGSTTNNGSTDGSATATLYVNNASNDYTGGTEIANGRIAVSNSNALGTNIILFSTTNPAYLQIRSNDMAFSQNFVIGTGTGSSVANAVIDTMTNTVTLSGSIANRTSSNAGALFKIGSGPLILSGTSTYTGGTTISDGTLVVSGALNGGSSVAIKNSANSRLVLSNTTALASTTSLIGDSTSTTTGTLELAAGGNYTLNSYGTTTLAGHNMYFTNSSGTNATLTFTNATNFITFSSATSFGRFLINNSPDLTITFNGAVDIGSSNTNDVTFGGAGNFVVNGSIFNTNTNSARSLIKSGGGTLSLKGTNNTYSSTTVSGGNLEVVSTNLSAQITTNTVFITFSNGVGVGSYTVLPGALTGTYLPATYTNLSTGLKAAFNQTSGQVLVSVAPPTGTLSYSLSPVVGMYQTSISSLTPSGVTGLELTYSISPTLPTGLSIDSNTGVISGTPLAAKVQTPYTVTVSNSAGSITTEVSITVSKANQGSAVSGSLGLQTITFDGTTTVTASGGNGSGVYEFRQSSGTGAVNFSGTGFSRTITPTAAGTAVIEVRRVADSNYNDSSWVSAGTLTVNPANQAAVSGSLGLQTITFDGTTTVTASGGNGSGVYEFRQSGGTGAVNFSGTGFSRTITPTAAGTAVIEVRRVADSNYNNSSWVTAGTLTVNKANQAAVLGSLGLQTITVGGTTTVTASGGTGTGAYEFRQGSGTGTVGFSGTGDSRTIVGNTAGTAVIEVRRVADSNYNNSSWVTVGTLTVNPAGSTYTSVGFTEGTEYDIAANGLSNLMNYALGQNGPNAPFPVPPVLSTGSNGVTLAATARTDDLSLRFYVEWTTDLSGVTDTWHSTEVSAVNLSGTIAYGELSKFLRFRVSN